MKTHDLKMQQVIVIEGVGMKNLLLAFKFGG